MKYKYAPTSKAAAAVPPEILSSDEEYEVEESSSCDFDAYLSNSSDLGLVGVPINSPATNGAFSPSSPWALAEGSDIATEIANRVNYASSSSDPMIAEVAAAIREWEIVKKKTHSSRNVQHATAKGVGSMRVGLAVLLDSVKAFSHDIYGTGDVASCLSR
ncbi:hypothetical protein SADUNF_Sadunf03G0011800 [Salix dunnii]|uniref:Uncharacterized protein n=1 Tax=Salix dunnii TaxID=1413687 RepID=A0A835K964_9ROSI|nr:hypothetical protein SADUNF_Sadunf03G0011800 [Salix dunnii]